MTRTIPQFQLPRFEKTNAILKIKFDIIATCKTKTKESKKKKNTIRPNKEN